MKISTGTLVLNAASTLPMGMLWAQLEHLYSFSDEIFITEGATKATSHYWDGDASWLTSDGHSTDETINIIKSFPDPQNKIILIQKDGFWDGKTEMCNEWSKRATGDYLWQIDSDEFYHEKDIEKIIKLLSDESPDQVDFFANFFWGDFNHCTDERDDGKWSNDMAWQRIFKHTKGSKWISHEPPTYQHPDGTITFNKNRIGKNKMLEMGIKMFHYSYVCKEQVDFKSKFFKNSSYIDLWEKWHYNKSIKLLNTGNGGPISKKFKAQHPECIRRLLWILN